jgi:hypothetical protein
MRLHTETLKKTLADGTPEKKLELLEILSQEMDGWDIFPVKLVLPCLYDTDGRVCCMAIRILSCLAGDSKLRREEVRALLGTIGHPDNSVREALIEMFRRTRFVLQRSDLEELIPLVRHQNDEVRTSAVRLFLEVPYLFDQKLCVRLADTVLREDLHIQATIYELLAGLGQEHFLAREQDVEPDDQRGSINQNQ